MKRIELYMIDGMIHAKEDDRSFVVNESARDFIDKVLNVIKDNYPITYKSLDEYYKDSALNKPYHKFRIVNRFLKCNFAKLDTTHYDIETDKGDMVMNFENVDCPLKDECKLKGIVCMPKFNSNLSNRELEVAKLWLDGLDAESIAEKLYLSTDTVKNHVRNIYDKIGVHTKMDFAKYMIRHNIY